MFRSLAIVLVLLSGAACNVMSAGVQGSGVAASEDRQTSVFERVEVDGSFAVEITVGPVQSVRVEADANLLPIITTEVADATLKVASKQNYSTTSPLRVTVTAPIFRPGRPSRRPSAAPQVTCSPLVPRSSLPSDVFAARSSQLTPQ